MGTIRKVTGEPDMKLKSSDISVRNSLKMSSLEIRVVQRPKYHEYRNNDVEFSE